MDIEIRADKDAVLGGPDQSPYLQLALREDGYAVLETGHGCCQDIGRAGDGCTGVWSASLSPGSYVIADMNALNALAARLRPLVARVFAERTVFKQAEYSAEASAEIEKLMNQEQWWDEERQVWDADEWLYDLGYLGTAKDYGLSLTSSDDAYEAAGKKIQADALRYGVILVNVEELLLRIRQSLRDTAREDA